MSESLEDKLFSALKNDSLRDALAPKAFPVLAAGIIKEHGSKFLYETFTGSIKKYLFDNEKLFEYALLEIDPSERENKEFWIEALKKPQFLDYFAFKAKLGGTEYRRTIAGIYGREFLIQKLEELEKTLPDPNMPIILVQREEYYGKERRQKLKEGYAKIINEEYKQLLNDYTIYKYESNFKNACPNCEEELKKITFPNVKGEYTSCEKDKILFIEYNQNLRLFRGWAVNQLFN